MKVCPNCKLENSADASKCIKCGAKFGIWGEPPEFSHSKAERISKSSLAWCAAGVHFLVSGLIGFVAFAQAWGGALSDSYHEESDLPNVLLIVLEAPVALIQSIAVRIHSHTHQGLDLASLFLLACVWSISFGWLFASIYKKCTE